MNHLGEKIKELRMSMKMTQSEFANRISVTKSAVSSYENGSRLPSYDVLIKISRVFKVSTDNLLGNSSKSVIDVTGLTQKQTNILREIVITFQRHNILCQKIADDDNMLDALMTMGLASQDDVDWLKSK